MFGTPLKTPLRLNVWLPFCACKACVCGCLRVHMCVWGCIHRVYRRVPPAHVHMESRTGLGVLFHHSSLLLLWDKVWGYTVTCSLGVWIQVLMFVEQAICSPPCYHFWFFSLFLFGLEGVIPCHIVFIEKSIHKFLTSDQCDEFSWLASGSLQKSQGG